MKILNTNFGSPKDVRIGKTKLPLGCTLVIAAVMERKDYGMPCQEGTASVQFLTLISG